MFTYTYMYMNFTPKEFELHVSICIYSGVPILRTSKGNENWFEKSESSKNGG